MRLARVYRKRGAHEQALRTYDALAELGPLVVEELPSALSRASDASASSNEAGRQKDLGEEATRLAENLRGGRWQLTKSQYETYSTDRSWAR